ncbi:questin oxidase family protein [Streptomyces sp. NPDC052036]|uniref:questin oxidase family protein n=1 Tax=unclassified Streptomyces TaxID=2593676 RepID=UPI00343EF9F9
MTSVNISVLDEGLHRLRHTGPEYTGTLTNHGPMVIEALTALGRPDAVQPWLSGYLPQLDSQPACFQPIERATWRRALGDVRRVTDWQLFFRAELSENNWLTTATTWWSRLLPGVAAGATHGIIRTSHALRSMAEFPSDERLRELAGALAYWAARYTELPGSPAATGCLSLRQAVCRLPLHPNGVHPGLIRDRLDSLSVVPGFPEAVSALHSPASPDQGMTELAEMFAELFVTYGRQWPTAFVHAVTAPVAASSVLHLLPPELQRHTHDHLWQLAAALYTAHAPTTPIQPLPADNPPVPADLTDQAVTNGDEHAIKLTEACLRVYGNTNNPTLLHAAAAGLALLPEEE